MSNFEACDVRNGELLYSMCRNVHTLGMNKFGMRKGRIACKDDNHHLFITDDVPDYVPFQFCAVTRVAELYKRLKYFYEVSTTNTIEVYYEVGKSDPNTVLKMKFKSKETDIEFRFASDAALGQLPLNIKDGDIINNVVLFGENERKNLLKGLNSIQNETVFITANNGKVTFNVQDTMGDGLEFKLQKKQKCLDFKRAYETSAFMKFLSHSDNDRFFVGESKFLMTKICNLETFMLTKVE